MTPEFLILAVLLFIPVVGISFVALRRAWEPKDPVLERQKKAAPELLPESSSEYLFEGLTKPLAGMLPSTEDGRVTLQQELRTAGYYHLTALTDFLSLRNVLVLLALLLAFGLALVLDAAYIPAIVIGAVLAAILGFSLPRIFIQMRGSNRTQQIRRALPTGVDLLTLALTSGLSLQAALKRVAGELRFSYPVLSEELDFTRRQAELGSLEHGLDQLAERVHLPEMRNLAIILAQSERLGSNATGILMETSNNLRTTMRQRAETQANRASFWMLIPTVACFLVAASLLIIGPVFLEFRRQMGENRELVKEGQKNINSIRPSAKNFKAAP
jgi:tight adherence protein C